MGLYYKLVKVDDRQVLIFSNNRRKLEEYSEKHKEEFTFHNRIRTGDGVVVAEPENDGDLKVFDEPEGGVQNGGEEGNDNEGILGAVGL